MEERVRLVSEQLALIADVFGLIAIGTKHVPERGLSGDGARTLATACAAANQDLEDLLHALPIEVLNSAWRPRRRKP